MPLDLYDEMPRAMKAYLRNYGWHFNKEACDFAISKMTKNGTKLNPVNKDQVDKLMQRHNIDIKNNKGYDYVFVANMCKADYYGSSIEDEKHLVLYVKDTLDDEDAADGTTMRRWYATMVANGEPIEWEDFL